jgi:hypothetical protein
MAQREIETVGGEVQCEKNRNIKSDFVQLALFK